MAKHRPPDPPDAERDDAPEPVTQPPADPGYTVATWLGHTSYHCRTCPLGTLSMDEIERHVGSCRAT